jgi:peptide-methionine (R)-S-oxide reductase
LFDSETKFNSGTDGLVLCSFKQKRVKEVDNSLGMVRGEIVCARCGHLGHLLMMVPIHRIKILHELCMLFKESK